MLLIILGKQIRGKQKEATRTTGPINHDKLFRIHSESDEMTSLSLLNGRLQNETAGFPSFPDI